MTETVLFSYPLKPGQKDAWVEWCKEAMTREKEALKVMKSEGVSSESCFLSEDGKTVYLYYETESLTTTYKRFMESKAPIAMKHRMMIDQALNTKYSKLKTLFAFQQPKT